MAATRTRGNLGGMLVAALAAALLLLLLPTTANAAEGYFWVKDRAGHKVGWVHETGPGLHDWSYVCDMAGKELGSASGHYALRMSQVMFFREGSGGIWRADGRKLWNMSGKLIGHAVKRSGRWVVYKKIKNGNQRRGTVKGSLPAPHALMGLRLLLWN